MLKIENLSVRVGGKDILRGINLEIKKSRNSYLDGILKRRFKLQKNLSEGFCKKSTFIYYSIKVEKYRPESSK